MEGGVKVMMISVGAPKTRGIAAAIREYESRIPHYFKFEALQVRPSRLRAGADPAAVAEKESEALRARVPEGLQTIAVDERGITWSSEELAAYLGDLAVLGQSGAAFLIGGPAGLSERLRISADRVLSLSSFTLPHELARLVLAEQIYRAGTIHRGEPYHRGG